MKTNNQRVTDAMLLILDDPDADTEQKLKAARVIATIKQTHKRAAKQKRSDARGQLSKFTKP